MTRYRVKTETNLSVSHNGKVYVPGSILPADLTEEQADSLFESGAIEEVSVLEGASEQDSDKSDKSDDSEDATGAKAKPEDAASSNPSTQEAKTDAATKASATSKPATTKPATGGKL